MADPTIELKEVTKIYPDGNVRALDHLSLAITKGEFVSVMGPSGSGKSTLLNLIGSLDTPTSGQILIEGVDLGEVRGLAKFRAETVGFVFQMHNLLPALTAYENILTPSTSLKTDGKRSRQRAKELLEMVGLKDRMGHRPNQLSGGERQRVAVARALINDPAIILADEPTGSLDTESGNQVMELLKQINQEQGRTIIAVTHDPRVARFTQRIVDLLDGRIVHDHAVGSELLEDLRDLKESHLGTLLLTDEVGPELEELGLARAGRLSSSAHVLRDLLVTIDP